MNRDRLAENYKGDRTLSCHKATVVDKIYSEF